MTASTYGRSESHRRGSDRISEPGDWRLPTLGEDLDIRTDIPLYRVWRKGELIEEVIDLKKVWRDDLVSFVLG